MSNRSGSGAEDIAASLPSERYDLVIAVECLHDMPHPVPVLTAMRELCAPGGAVLSSTKRSPRSSRRAATRCNGRCRLQRADLPSLGDGGQPNQAIGTVLRPSALRKLARRAGFTGVEVLDVEHPMWRFYGLAT